MQGKKKFFIVTTVSDSLPFFRGQLEVLKQKFDISLVSSPGVYMDEMVAEHNVPAFPLQMQREISPAADVKSLLQLIRLFRKEKPYVVHGNTPKGSLLSLVAATFTGVPVRIYYVHGLRYISEHGRKRHLLMMMERISCFFATDIIAVSPGAREQLRADKITTKPISLIGKGSINGINTEYFNRGAIQKANIDGIEENDFVYGFIGRIVRDKGIVELIAAFLQITQELSNIKLLIVGSFENDLNVPNEIADAINNHSQIIFAGRQSDVRPYYKAMDVFVLPSYREGLCGVVLEASSMEVPVISTDISGVREIISNQTNGILVPPRDIENLLNAMRKMYEDLEMRKKLVANAKLFVKDNFDQKTVWKNSLEKYEEIVEKHV